MRQPSKNDYKIQVRLPEELKKAAEEKLAKKGLSLSEYIRKCLEDVE